MCFNVALRQRGVVHIDSIAYFSEFFITTSLFFQGYRKIPGNDKNDILKEDNEEQEEPMNQTAGLQRLTKQQLPQITAMMGRAFHNDPQSIYLYPQEARRARCLPLMFGISLRYALRYGEITIPQGETGVACWLPPGKTTLSILRMLRVGALQTAFQMGSEEVGRMRNTEDYAAKMHQRCMSRPHWYLWGLAVEPAQQGQGIGGKLLRAGLKRADDAALPCYLETTNTPNVSLYQKFGFRVVEEGDIGDISGGSFHIWSMVRPASAQEE